MKNIILSIIALAILTLACFIAFKSCDKKPEIVEHISINEIQRRITDSLIFANNAKIRKFYEKDSIQKANIKSLSTERNRLLAIVRGFKGVRIDSINQTVNNIPIAVYEAEMNANLICDTLLQFKDVQISLRDSIIQVKSIEIEAVENMNKANEQALKDLIALNQQDKNKLKRAKSLNKKIPLFTSIGIGIGFILATFAL